MQKSKKKTRKKNFLWDVFLCGFPISGDKKGGKSKCFFFFRKGRGKCEINYKKKKFFFSPLWSFFTIFGREFAGKDDQEVFRG